MPSKTRLSRRTALKLTGGSLAAVGTAGFATGRDRPGVVNVGYATDAGRRAVLDVASAVVREFAFDALTIRAPETAVAGLKRRPDVRYVEHDGRWQAQAELYTEEARCICAPEAHSCGSCGSGADVAIIDTGIDSDHPDLQANLGTGRAFVGCKGSPKKCRYAWDDDNGHGTHVAGIPGAVDNSEGIVGVAPCATYHAVKVLDKDGAGSWSDVAAGIEWTADQGYDVANMSFGGTTDSFVVRDAVEYAHGSGVLLVAGAGNESASCPTYPAAYPEVVAVGGYDCETQTTATFSCTSSQIDLIAPSVNVYSTALGGGYETRSGTSLAAAFVSGVGALAMADGYSNTGARDRMCQTACDVGLSTDEQGCGLVNAARAVGCSCECPGLL